MTRDEIEHVLRAAAAIAKETSFVLVGSQAVALLLDSPPDELLDAWIQRRAAEAQP